jgi:hypothetical protein
MRYIQNSTKQSYGLLIHRSIIAIEISDRVIESCRNMYRKVKERANKRGKGFLLEN